MKFLNLLGIVFAVLMFLSPTSTASEGGYWTIVERPQDTPAETDTDSVGFFELGSGSADCQAYLDFNVNANVTGTWGTAPSLLGHWIVSQFQTDVNVGAEWNGKTIAFYTPDTSDPTEPDIGHAEVEGTAHLDGTMDCDDWPASYSFVLQGRITSDLLDEAIEVEENDNGQFIGSGSFKIGAGGSPSGGSGSVTYSGSAGAFGGGWIPVHVDYGPHDDEDEGKACQNNYLVKGHATVKGDAKAGKGMVIPGKISFNLQGNISWADILLSNCKEE